VVYNHGKSANKHHNIDERASPLTHDTRWVSELGAKREATECGTLLGHI
jgi:hypothetical protein